MGIPQSLPMLHARFFLLAHFPVGSLGVLSERKRSAEVKAEIR